MAVHDAELLRFAAEVPALDDASTGICKLAATQEIHGIGHAAADARGYRRARLHDGHVAGEARIDALQ